MEKLTEWMQAEWGRKSALAVCLDLTPGAVSHWGLVPAERLLAIEKYTGIPRHQLRPDLFDGYTSDDYSDGHERLSDA